MYARFKKGCKCWLFLEKKTFGVMFFLSLKVKYRVTFYLSENFREVERLDSCVCLAGWGIDVPKQWFIPRWKTAKHTERKRSLTDGFQCFLCNYSHEAMSKIKEANRLRSHSVWIGLISRLSYTQHTKRSRIYRKWKSD